MITNVTQQYANKNAEAARRSLNNYVGATYPHYHGGETELVEMLINKGCEVTKHITPIKKRTEYDVELNGLYSGLIAQDPDSQEWTLVVTNSELDLTSE